MTHHTPERQAQVFDKDSGNAGLVAIANQFDGLNVRHVFTTEPLWIGKDVCGATPNTITPLDRGVKGLSNWFYHRMTK